ncbi:MAG TPA: T9SS type A sorting domain-containing protein [Bacteroidia bacterium]|nr:T9SS type A sorting domain-containing protein [Bacteroidia bacterium]HNT79344.1 T9SS type A sorting domain-containing protein [Bacteroidia bacterium]
MRNLYLFIYCILISVSTQAQPTITQSDAPVAGTQWTEFDDDRPGIFTLGAAGANQSWNYATGFMTQSTNYLSFSSIASLPGNLSSQFPGANLALNFPSDSICQYFDVNNTGIYIDGLYTYSMLAMPPFNKFDYNPNNLFIPFPFTYNGVRNHVSKQEVVIVGTPSIKTVISTLQQFNGDGYGSLTTPAGTFPNVLRIKSFSYSIDSTFADISGTGNYIFVNSGGASDSSYSYFHMRNGVNSFLCVVDMNNTNTVVESVSYLVNGIVGIEETSNPPSVLVYPNPLIDQKLNIHIDQDDVSQVRIYNEQGQVVYQQAVYGADTYSFEFDFSKGFYLYQLISHGGQIISNGKFIKQ